MAGIIEFLKDIWFRLIDFVKEYFFMTVDAELSFNGQWCFGVCLLILLLVGSACWASSIAAMRRHPILPHFILGLIIPWIYPLVILFTLGIHGEAARKKAEQAMLQKRQEEEEENKRIQAELLARQQSEAIANGNVPTQWTQQYFDSISRNANGENDGPWKAVIGKDEITVLEIIETQPDLIYVLFKGFNGEESKIRIPYDKIVSWDKIQAQ